MIIAGNQVLLAKAVTIRGAIYHRMFPFKNLRAKNVSLIRRIPLLDQNNLKRYSIMTSADSVWVRV